jgi:hypothetical protein
MYSRLTSYFKTFFNIDKFQLSVNFKVLNRVDTALKIQMKLQNFTISILKCKIQPKSVQEDDT